MAIETGELTHEFDCIILVDVSFCAMRCVLPLGGGFGNIRSRNHDLIEQINVCPTLFMPK